MPVFTAEEYEHILHNSRSGAVTQTRRKIGRGYVKPIGMNKTEAAYDEHLRILKYAGKILYYEFEAIKFRLADNTFYTPDFLVQQADGTLEVHEVKGHWEDDARVKIKVAAEHKPFLFIAVTVRSNKDGGGYKYEFF